MLKGLRTNCRRYQQHLLIKERYVKVGSVLHQQERGFGTKKKKKRVVDEEMQKKIDAGTTRYNAEKEVYDAKLKELRIQYKLESDKNFENEMKARIEHQKRNEEWVKNKDHQIFKEREEMNRVAHELELTPMHLWEQITPEQREAELQKRREEKLERRRYTYEKLQKKRKEQDQLREMMLQALTDEAGDWLTDRDIQNDTLLPKLEQRLMDIHPITAAFNNIPKHHCDVAYKYKTQDNFFNAEVFPWVEEDDEPQRYGTTTRQYQQQKTQE